MFADEFCLFLLKIETDTNFSNLTFQLFFWIFIFATNNYILTMASFFPQHIISIRDLSIDFVQYLLQASEHMKKVVETSGGNESLKNKV